MNDALQIAHTVNPEEDIPSWEEWVTYIEDRHIQQAEYGAQTDQITLPSVGGRVSIPEFQNGFLSLLFDSRLTLTPDFNIKFLDAIQHLAAFNHDVSFAIDNIVNLANTEYKIEFVESISDEQQKEFAEHLRTKLSTWYNHSEGTSSLTNDLLAQAAINGALSAEMVPSEDLSGIRQIVRVNPKNIKFRYNKEEERFQPVQEAGRLGGQETNDLGQVELNETTYRYLALRRFSESPYAIPPFLSALDSLTTQKDMLDSLKFVMKKLGMMGFLEVLIDAPKKKPGESDAAFTSRCIDYMNQIGPEMAKGLTNGLVVGFKGRHEFRHNSVATDARGVNELYNLNEQNLMAGLKQAPEMLGRQFNTSETFGRVILAKLSTQLVNYQKLVGCFYQAAFNLELILAGFTLENVIKAVVFDKPMISDKQREAEARAKEIDNANKLFNQGVISQLQRAQMLGFDEPAEEEPRFQFSENGNPGNGPEDGKQPTNPNPREDETGEGSTKASNAGLLVKLAKRGSDYFMNGGGVNLEQYNKLTEKVILKDYSDDSIEELTKWVVDNCNREMVQTCIEYYEEVLSKNITEFDYASDEECEC